MSETRSYPRHAKTDAGDIEFRLMSRADEPAVLVFAQKLRWLPAGGYVPLERDPLGHLLVLAMPAGTIAVGLAAFLAVGRSVFIGVLAGEAVLIAGAYWLAGI